MDLTITTRALRTIRLHDGVIPPDGLRLRPAARPSRTVMIKCPRFGVSYPASYCVRAVIGNAIQQGRLS